MRRHLSTIGTGIKHEGDLDDCPICSESLGNPASIGFFRGAVFGLLWSSVLWAIVLVLMLMRK